MYIGTGGKLKPLADPDTGKPLPMQALGGPTLPAKDDPRKELVDWMTAKDNPFFARSFANRVWAHYMGVGIVHPVDDFSLANPPSFTRTRTGRDSSLRFVTDTDPNGVVA